MDRRRSRPHPSVELISADDGGYRLRLVQAGRSADFPAIVQRGARRSIGLAIRDAQLLIHLPARATLADAIPFISSKASWLGKHLTAQQSRTPPPDFTDGSRIDFLGEPLTVTLLPGRTRAVDVSRDEGYLVIRVPVGKPADAIPPAVAEWMAGQAMALFLPRLAHFVVKLELKQTPPLSLSSARQKWGSCDRLGAIKLNWRLLQAPSALIDYVICHELAHLKEFNHSPAFWRIVELLCPDYKRCRQQLKDVSHAWLSW